jgi:hypothetical protein
MPKRTTFPAPSATATGKGSGSTLPTPMIPATSDESSHMRRVVRARWDAVRFAHEQYMSPFRDESVEDAMRYLEELRKVCEEGAKIMNERINDYNKPKFCSGPNCKKSVDDRVDGRGNHHPGWVSQKVLKDPDNPGIMRTLFFCSELCDNAFARKHNGAMGGTQ